MNIDELKKVAVVGAGSMGHGIAQLAVMAGYEVSLCDIKKEYVDRGICMIFASLEKLSSKGKVDPALVETIKSGKIKGFTEISEAVRNCGLIIEAVPEVEEIKNKTLAEIDRYAKRDAIIATNTSSMNISDLAKATAREDKVIGTHYFNPPVMMKLVEIIMGEKTSEDTLSFASDYVDRIGKVKIVARKYSPGFIANRIGAPVDIYRGVLLDEDHIDVFDADVTMRNAGMKMGFYLLQDFCGIDVMRDGMKYYQKHLSPDYEPPKTADKMISEGKLGKKSGEGYYVWPEKGLPGFKEDHYTGTFDPDIPYFIEANEATKLYEEGICSLEDCDKAIKYGYNTPGPIEYIKDTDPEIISNKLHALAEKYHKKVFEPTDTIKSGAYKNREVIH